MSRRTRLLLLAAAVTWALISGGCSAAPPASPGGAQPGASSASQTASASAPKRPPLPPPGQWAPEITNTWFPQPPGTTRVYTGVKDGQAVTDTVVVTPRKKTIQGIAATVILDKLTSTAGGQAQVLEDTEDWYAQDKEGNVWYLGEATRTYEGSTVSTEGSWESGVDGAQGGLFMPANPQPGMAFYQEFYKGHAEDTFRILTTTATADVPYGTFEGAMVTEERTVLEPDVTAQKTYAKGVGQVEERDIGADEYAKLVTVKKAAQ